MNQMPSIGKNAIFLNALPYLNVLPLGDQKLDLWALNSIGSELPVQLIAKLLKQESFNIGINLSIFKKQSKSTQQTLKALQESFRSFTKSSEPIAVGYPLVILEDAALGRSIAAPLFIWELDLHEAEDGKQEHWMLHYDNRLSLKYNEILKNYLITRFDLDWEELMGEPRNLKTKQLLSALNRLAAAIQIDKPDIPKLFPCPSESYPAAFSNGILWAGMIGRMEPEKEDIVELPLSLQPRTRRTWFTRVGGLSLDSAQNAAVDAFFNSEDLLLVGEENSGKTRTVAALLPSVLADNGSCLIISQEAYTLQKLTQFLEISGLGSIGILALQDEALDKNNFLEMLSELPNACKKLPKLDEQRYSLLLHQHHQWSNQLSSAYRAMQQEILKDSDWTNTVGEFMHYHHIDGKQFLSRLLDTTDFDWSETEYRYLLQQIAENEPLFDKIHDLHHPLTALQDDIFLQLDETAATEKVTNEIKVNTRLLRDLYRNYTTFIDEYSDDLRFHYENHIKDLKQRLQLILRNLKVYQDVYGNSFDFIDSFSNTRLRILSVFSKKHQQILAAKEQIYTAYDELKTLYESKHYFEYNLPAIRQHINLSDITEDLMGFEKAADEWFQKIPKIVKQKVKELNSKIPIKPNQKRKLEELESQVDAYFVQLYNRHLLEKDFKIKSYKSIERETYLRNLLETLTRIEDSLSQFSNFYQWRRHWLSMESKCRKVIESLIAVRPSGWQTAFKSWYLYHYLDKQYKLALPDRELPFSEFLVVQKELKGLLSSNSLLVTRERQQEQIRILRKERALQLSQVKAKFNMLTLSEIIAHIGIEAVLEFFPIVFVTPAMANQIFAHKVPLFDTVILEDAQYIDPKLGRRLARLGAQKVVTGDSKKAGKHYLSDVQNSPTFTIFELNGRYSKDAKTIQLPQINTINIPHQFRKALFELLSDYIRPERLEVGVKLADGNEIDLVIKAEKPTDSPIAIVIDGSLKALDQYDYEQALAKTESIKKEGYNIYPVWSLDWWKNPDKSVQNLVAFILK